MAVVGADDDVVLAGVLQDVGQVLFGLARDVEAVSAQHVCLFVQLPGAGAVEARAQVGDEVGDPGGGGFEEAPAEVRELLALLVFVGVTLMGHRDSDFFAFGAETQLPLVNISAPTVSFFIAAPISAEPGSTALTLAKSSSLAPT